MYFISSFITASILNTFIVVKQVSRWLLLGSLTEIYNLSMNKGHGCLLSSLLLLIFHYGAGNKRTECVGAGSVLLGLNGRLKTMRNSAKRLSGEQTRGQRRYLMAKAQETPVSTRWERRRAESQRGAGQEAGVRGAGRVGPGRSL